MKRFLILLLIFMQLLSGCKIGGPTLSGQNTSEPTGATAASKPVDPTNQPTQPTEPPAKPTQPPTTPPTMAPTTPDTKPTSPPTTPTETLSYADQLKTYTPIADYTTKICMSRIIPEKYTAGITPYANLVRSKEDYSSLDCVVTGSLDLTTTNADYPKSFQEIFARYDGAFFAENFLVIVNHEMPVGSTLTIKQIAVGEPVFFNNKMLISVDCTKSQNKETCQLSIFVELPRKYLEYTDSISKYVTVLMQKNDVFGREYTTIS